LPPSLRPSSQGKAANTTAPTTAFGDFCQRVAEVRVREPLGAPARLKGLPTPIVVVGGASAAAAAAASALDPGPIPSMRELGFAEGDLKGSSAGGGNGGEAEALRQLRALAAELKQRSGGGGWQQRRATCSSASAAAAETAAASAAFAARISPWLAVGCLSPREVFAELGGKGAAAGKDKKQKKDKSTGGAEANGSNNGWLGPQLLLRDFFGMLNAWRNQHQQVSGAAVGASASAAVPPQLAFA
jgi:hypothetical protein